MEPENNAKKANDDDNLSGTSGPVEVVEKKSGSESYSHSSVESQSEEEDYEEPPKEVMEEPRKKSPKKAVEKTAGFDWYKLTDSDTQFVNRVNRHASSLTLTLT